MYSWHMSDSETISQCVKGTDMWVLFSLHTLTVHCDKIALTETLQETILKIKHTTTILLAPFFGIY